MRGEQFEVSPGKDVDVPLDGQGTVLKRTAAQRRTGGYRREDGTLMVPSVPTFTDTIPLVTGQVAAVSESSEAEDRKAGCTCKKTGKL